ncbi:SDR family oxidoreductase [Streptomyces sp. NRRL S-337]|uniref:SDR family oxidoreductase n=1 Tax=Streptomyces sp. NRRL S-337 TaxID=1463900 RepID=UPI0004C5FA71|nr:SDR family oxidoreductase [Streptomyces sp. NRRL S-337]
MNETMITLVTGANKGIGRQIAAQLGALGHSVVVGARNTELGQKAATELRESGADATSVMLDVTDPDSAAAAAAEIEARYGRLDALVNNAGISVPPGSDLGDQRPSTADMDVLRAVFETNYFGVIAVTNAMLPLLRRSASPRIVNVSSSVGSLNINADLKGTDGPPLMPVSAGYVTSKTALTALTLQYAWDLLAEDIKVNAVCPGYVATDLNGHRGHRTPAEGAVAAVRMATIGADGPTGTFTDDEGPAPW